MLINDMPSISDDNKLGSSPVNSSESNIVVISAHGAGNENAEPIS
jgi:hypothetical protein